MQAKGMEGETSTSSTSTISATVEVNAVGKNTTTRHRHAETVVKTTHTKMEGGKTVLFLESLATGHCNKPNHFAKCCRARQHEISGQDNVPKSQYTWKRITDSCTLESWSL